MAADDARHRQQNRRAKLRAEGLVMREVWILPQHAPLLLKVEKLLRKPNSRPLVQALQGVSAAMSTSPVTPQSLYASLQAGELAGAVKAGSRGLHRPGELRGGRGRAVQSNRRSAPFTPLQRPYSPRPESIRHRTTSCVEAA